MGMILVGQNINTQPMSFKKIISVVALLAFAIFGFAIYLNQTKFAEKSSVSSKTKVRIGIVTVSTSLPIKVAQSKTYLQNTVSNQSLQRCRPVPAYRCVGPWGG
jgi:hypothetical protein